MKNSLQIISLLYVFLIPVSSFAMIQKPQRIVCLSISALESLAVLHVQPVGFAITASGKIPSYLEKDIEKIPQVGSIANPSLEKIQSLKPDLILIDRVYENQINTIEKLKKIAPVMSIRSENYHQTFDQLFKTATLLGKEDIAKNFVSKFNKLLAESKKKIEAKNSSIMAFFVSNNVLWAWTDESFLASLIIEMNFRYKFKGKGDKNYKDMLQINWETLLDLDPDYLIVFQEPHKNIFDFLNPNPIWKNLAAVKKKHVISVDRDIWSRSRGPLAAQTIVQQMVNLF